MDAFGRVMVVVDESVTVGGNAVIMVMVMVAVVTRSRWSV